MQSFLLQFRQQVSRTKVGPASQPTRSSLKAQNGHPHFLAAFSRDLFHFKERAVLFNSGLPGSHSTWHVTFRLGPNLPTSPLPWTRFSSLEGWQKTVDVPSLLRGHKLILLFSFSELVVESVEKLLIVL
jgi:hypothetical protein